ncbi:MAG: hypothetical protein B6244_05670 [Candidatus Cloacimonetes bacterium 4572_55]|nr:MAG: hypothetical protein B6244_05670 [Candidatus Cloacimonetes bacterium 4572_55]
MQKNSDSITRKTLALYIFIAIFGSLIANFVADYVQARNNASDPRLTELTRILDIIDQHYVEDVMPDDLIDHAIDGMLLQLDPYSNYMKKESYDDLMLHSKGEFGGLGIRIAIRNEVLTIIAPIEGTPAKQVGISAGDQIISVEEESTTGWTVQDAIEVLRGPKGSEVRITVRRPGATETIDFKIVRDIIQIHSVPYAFMMTDEIGYIGVVEFSEKTSDELNQAIDELKEEGMESLILDLRNNPGGLLEAAIEVSDIFLDKDKMIVYTRGRTLEQNQEFTARFPLPRHNRILLAVLVNEGSASASEIVAGAIQDHDAGIIIGKETFGKGSVQSIFPLSDTRALKLTTAKYYTPSGRCIHKDRDHDDLEVLSDSSDIDISEEEDTEREKFKTSGNRTVYGGGGITPDMIREGYKYSDLMRDIFRESILFDFTVGYVNQHPDADLTVTEKMRHSFFDFITEETEISVTKEEFEEIREELTQEMRYNLALTLYNEERAQAVRLEKNPQVQHAIDCLKKATGIHDLIQLASVESDEGSDLKEK